MSDPMTTETAEMFLRQRDNARDRAEKAEARVEELEAERDEARNLARTFTIERANEKQRAEAAEARCASVREYNDRLRFDLERMEARCASIAAERDRLREELDEAHTWLLSAEMCDCEYFPGAGTKLCRFAEALDEFSPAASSPEPESEGRRHAIEDEAAASLGSDKRDGPRQLHCVTCGVTVPVDVQHAEHLALHIGHQCRYVEVAEREHTGHHGQPCWCVVERIERAALAAARVQSEDHVGHGTYRHEETGGTDGSPQGEDHEAGIEAATTARLEEQRLPTFGPHRPTVERAVRTIVAAYLARVSPPERNTDKEENR